jgi:hypothetical protein
MNIAFRTFNISQGGKNELLRYVFNCPLLKMKLIFFQHIVRVTNNVSKMSLSLQELTGTDETANP